MSKEVSGYNPEDEGEEKDPFTPDQRKVFDEVNEKGGFYFHPDFVSQETYRELLEGMELKGKKIIDVAAGFVQYDGEWGSPYFIELAGQVKGLTLIPVELNALPIKSWKLGDDGRPRESVEDSVVTPVRGDAYELPFKDASVDGAVSINFFNASTENAHDNAFGAVQEIFRVLKEGGFVIISQWGYTRVELEDGSFTLNNDIPEEEIISRDDLIKIATIAGFSEISDIEMSGNRVQKYINDIKPHLESESPVKVKEISVVEPVALMLKK